MYDRLVAVQAVDVDITDRHPRGGCEPPTKRTKPTDGVRFGEAKKPGPLPPRLPLAGSKRSSVASTNDVRQSEVRSVRHRFDPPPSSSPVGRWALRPQDPTEAQRLESYVEASRGTGVSKSLLKKEKPTWDLWTTFCREAWGTDPIRANKDAHEGRDRAGQADEHRLQTTFLVWMVGKVKLSVRSGNALPNTLYGHVNRVRLIHRRRWEIIMSRPLGLPRVFRSILVDFVNLNGPEALLPRRKEPIGHALLSHLLKVGSGLQIGTTCLNWSSTLGVVPCYPLRGGTGVPGRLGWYLIAGAIIPTFLAASRPSLKSLMAVFEILGGEGLALLLARPVLNPRVEGLGPGKAGMVPYGWCHNPNLPCCEPAIPEKSDGRLSRLKPAIPETSDGRL